MQNSSGSNYDIYEGTSIMDQEQIPSNAIRVHILKYFDHAPTVAEKQAMLVAGNYSYGYGGVSNATINGASIDYTDANGSFWSSQSGLQTGSTFSITEIVDTTDTGYDKILKASFNCKLYNGSSTVLQVSNATIRGKVLSP